MHMMIHGQKKTNLNHQSTSYFPPQLSDISLISIEI